MVQNHTFIFEGEEINITISIGASATKSEGLTIGEFITKADSELYRAKTDGRNCVRG